MDIIVKLIFLNVKVYNFKKLYSIIFNDIFKQNVKSNVYLAKTILNAFN